VVGRRCCAAGLADQQVSPTGLAFVPMLIGTAIPSNNRDLRDKTFRFGRFFGAAHFHLNATSLFSMVAT
jgi:hypothetical protein